VTDRYGHRHRRLRAYLVATMDGRLCARCGRPLRAGDAVDLDHVDGGGPTDYLGLAHAHCNRSTAARKGNALRGQRRRLKYMKDVVLGVEISTDRQHTSVVAAGRLDDTVVAFELVGYFDGTDTAALVRDLAADRSAQVVIDPRSPAATLIEPLSGLNSWGRKLLEPTAHDVAVAHGRFVDELRAGRLKYKGHWALDAAVQHADTRPLAGAEAVERRRTDVDVSPLTAA
jgi:hypothetical protein